MLKLGDEVSASIIGNITKIEESNWGVRYTVSREGYNFAVVTIEQISNVCKDCGRIFGLNELKTIGEEQGEDCYVPINLCQECFGEALYGEQPLNS